MPRPDPTHNDYATARLTLALVLLVGPCACAPVTVTAPTNDHGGVMRIDLDRTSFTVPQGYEDVTNYTFKPPGGEPGERVMVVYGEPPEDGKTVDTLIESRRRRFAAAGDGRFKVGDVRSDTLAGLNAKETSLTYRDGDRTFRDQVAVALLGQTRYVQVTYTTDADAPDADARFAHILHSAALAPSVAAGANRTAPARATAGFARRTAGVLTLDVPAPLRPPVAYQFRTPDERFRLTVREHLPEPGSPRPTFPPEQVRSVLPGATLADEPRETALTIGTARGSLQQATVTVAGPPATRAAVRAAMLTFPDGTSLTVAANGPADAAAELDQALDQVLQSAKQGR